METKNAIKWLEAEYPKGVELVYIDYRDSIESAETREKLLQDPENDYEIVNGNDWITDSQYEGIRYIVEEYEKTLDGEEIDEETHEAMRDWLFEHDTSTPIKDLLKNTGNEYLYYDTGLEIEAINSYDDHDKQIKARARQIAKRLKVSYKKHAKELELLSAQAWDGGQLVILFTGKVADFMDGGKFIKFGGGASVCIMDRGQGSGDNTELGEKMIFEFKRENLHSDKGDSGYSYTHEVCGLVGGLYEDGFLTDKEYKNAIKVEDNEERKAEREREERYQKNWKAGKCTFGDMKISRHKDTPYRNDFPCGSKCTACGTFWID